MFKLIKHYYMRCKYGYSYRDLWDFDDYLCDIIPPAIRQLAKKHTGCPSDLYDKKATNNECHKWEEILEEIAQGFEAAKEITHIRYFKNVKQKDGYYSHEIDKKKAKLLAKKYDRGTKLFKDYFLSLWD